jgi:hypothetical protein
MLKKGKDPDPDPQGLDIKLRIRSRSKMFRIRNTACQTMCSCYAMSPVKPLVPVGRVFLRAMSSGWLCAPVKP